MRSIVHFCVFILICACNSKNTPQPIRSDSKIQKTEKNANSNSSAVQDVNNFNSFFIHTTPTIEEQISLFIRRIFQDSKSNYWLGTNGDGIVRYQPSKINSKTEDSLLNYFSLKQGFAGLAVRGILEDANGTLWFGTEGGLSAFNGSSFKNYTTEDGLVNNDIWAMCLDNKGQLWIGTYGGVSIYDGSEFRDFNIPESNADPNRGVSSKRIIHSIFEDSKRRMWFGTNAGAYYYEGGQLTNISEKDGLCNNAVNDIIEDEHGTIWFATHYGGVCRFDGSSFHRITEKEGVYGTEVWSLYKDQVSNIWFPTEGYGIYRYDGTTFSNFGEKEGLASKAVQSIYQDRSGRIWAGGHMGLYFKDGDKFVNISKTSPWPD